MRYPVPSSKTVLITGCSSGIGLATAHVLRAAGWRAVPTARKVEDLARLRADGFTPVALDVADPASVAAAVDATLALTGGTLGALVNNAGYGQPGAMEDLARDDMRRQFEVNVFGLQDLTNRLLPVFRAAGAGRVVNISSVVGRLSLPFLGIYSASKFALEAISDAMRVELTGTGIAVSLVEPGPIATRFGDNSTAAGRARLTDAPSRFREDYRRELGEEAEKTDRYRAFRLPPEAVAEKIRHAIESPRPRTRYPVTLVAHFGAFTARHAPDAVKDAVMRRRWEQKRHEAARP